MKEVEEEKVNRNKVQDDKKEGIWQSLYWFGTKP